MERTAEFAIMPQRQGYSVPVQQMRWFAWVVLSCILLSAALASFVPLQFSVVTLFLFAGPHNWFELRYFLTRLPLRLGNSRNFFFFAFAGVLLLSLIYVSLPSLYYSGLWSGENWPTMLGIWNTLLLLWLAILIHLRSRQPHRRDWFWVWPGTFGLCTLNWLAPELFSVAIVYLHPLIALWFLDRHLNRTRREWLTTYRRCLAVLPLVAAVMILILARTPSLADDNGLAWRITQNAGAEFLPNVSSHLLVSLHVFLEMLHYVVWLVALPLIGAGSIFPQLTSIPLYKHRRGFPRLILVSLALGLVLVAALWLGFSLDYAFTRDFYFAVAIAHVLAEAPFLLRTI